MADELTMELLTDIAAALRGVASDYLPAREYSITAVARPAPAVVLRVPCASHPPLQAALQTLSENLRDVLAEAIPSLPLRFAVIGGTEAAGIEITVQPGAEPVYGHVIKARVGTLRASNLLRGKPRLVDGLLREGQVPL